jgi:hypothetical protein
MQFNIQVNDESKVDFLLQLLNEFKFVEVSPLSKQKTNGNATKSGKVKHKPTPEQLQFIDDIREGLKEVELHRKGEIKLQTLQEFLDEVR